MVWTLQMVSDRNVPAHQIDEPAGNKERRDAARSPLMQCHRGVVDASEAADSRADQDACLNLLLVGPGAPIRVAQRLRRGAHAVDDEVVDVALFLRLHPVVGIKPVGNGAAARRCWRFWQGRSETLKFSTLAAPDLLAMSRRHVGSTPQANGLTMPRPVTTTRFMRSIFVPRQFAARVALKSQGGADKPDATRAGLDAGP